MKRNKKMIALIKKIFNLQKKISNSDKLEYKSTSILGKKQDLTPIPKINIPENNLKNILILDDNFEAGEITYYDIIFLFDLAEKLKKSGIDEMTKKQKDFITKLPNDLFQSLSTLKKSDFNIILVTGEMGAFSIYEAIDHGLEIDYAILDILIGGYNEYKGQCYILDGIDVSKKIQETNKECQYIFYSGCSLVENSDETIKYQKIYGENSQFHKKVVLKDKELNKKRMRILELINQ